MEGKARFTTLTGRPDESSPNQVGQHKDERRDKEERWQPDACAYNKLRTEWRRTRVGVNILVVSGRVIPS